MVLLKTILNLFSYFFNVKQQAPYLIYAVLRTIIGQNATDAYKNFRALAILLLTLKSSVNFVLYCWFSEKFWATLKRVFFLHKCLRYCRKNEDEMTTTMPSAYYSMRRMSSGNTRETTFTVGINKADEKL